MVRHHEEGGRHGVNQGLPNSKRKEYRFADGDVDHNVHHCLPSLRYGHTARGRPVNELGNCDVGYGDAIEEGVGEIPKMKTRKNAADTLASGRGV